MRTIMVFFAIDMLTVQYYPPCIKTSRLHAYIYDCLHTCMHVLYVSRDPRLFMQLYIGVIYISRSTTFSMQLLQKSGYDANKVTNAGIVHQPCTTQAHACMVDNTTRDECKCDAHMHACLHAHGSSPLCVVFGSCQPRRLYLVLATVLPTYMLLKRRAAELTDDMKVSNTCCWFLILIESVSELYFTSWR